MIKYTYNYIKESVNNLGYELLDKIYNNSITKLTLKDSEGYYYYIKFSTLHLGNIPRKFDKSNPYTIQNIRLWCKLNNKQFELLSDTYDGNNKYLEWKCLKEECGEIFKQNWGSIHNGQNCSVCAGRQVGLSNCLATKNPQLAKEWHPTLNGDLTPYDVTCNSGKYVWWQCSKNPKHEWPAKIYSRNDGNNCPYCFGRYPTKDNNLLICESELCKEWNYDKNKKRPDEYTPNSGKKVWWVCKECNHEWKCAIFDRSRKDGKKCGCPECNKSKGEKKIDEVLFKNNWIKIKQKEFIQLIDENKYNKNYYIPQKEFDGLMGLGGGLLSYDFYIPKLNFLIEYQGEQHKKYIPGFHKTYKDFIKQKEHDKRKKEYAQNNNINLLEIWYYDFDNIESILNNIVD